MRLQIDPLAIRGEVWLGQWRGRRAGRAERLLDDSGALGAVLDDAWQAAAKEALLAVLGELADATPLKGALLNVELADALVVMDVATGEFAGQSDRQLQTIAQACCAELLGAAQGQTEVRWQLQRDEKHLLICTLNQAVLAWLTEAAAQVELQLASVQPHFLRQWNVHAGKLRPGHGVFAVASGVHAVIACVAEGVITTLSRGPWLNPELGQVRSGRVAQLMTELKLEHTDTTPGLLDPHVDRVLKSASHEVAPDSAFELAGNWLKQRRARNIEVSGTDPLAEVDAGESSEDLLDARVERLLASNGDDVEAQTAFVLVSNLAQAASASSRWTMLGTAGSLA